MEKYELKTILKQLHPHLIAEISDAAALTKFPKNTEILREGQYVKVIPLVIEGLIKVFTRYQEKELLLYYIKPMESCIMSFAAGIENQKSRVMAIAEEETEALLLPVDNVKSWTKQYSEFNFLFFRLYNARYSDLLDTINHILFNKMDTRVYDYLVEKIKLTGKKKLKMSHRQIAIELGTAREVVSRILKKLEAEGKLKQESQTIEVTGL